MGGMSRESLEEAIRQVTARFPEMAGVRPSVSSARPDADHGLATRLGARVPPHGATERYHLTFKRLARGDDGSRIVLIVQATADAKGQVTKAVSSKTGS
jgi:hypothetical protein